MRAIVVGDDARPVVGGAASNGVADADAAADTGDEHRPARQGQQVAASGADLVIGAVLVPGARTPRLVTREMVRAMRPGSVLVDIAIDQGGCFEDSRPTTHSAPTFEVDGTVFYCVANMPGAVPHTSTYALTNATLTYALALADDGWRGACRARAELGRGLSTHDGVLYTEGVGRALGLETADAAALLA